MRASHAYRTLGLGFSFAVCLAAPPGALAATTNIALASVVASVASTGVAANVAPVTVAAGCPAPTVIAGHHTYFVDPIKGSMSGDGSAAHPWHTLQEVFDVHYKLIANAPTVYIAGEGYIKPNPDAPIKSGDTIYLNTGNHGSLLIQGNFGGTSSALVGYNNSDFITIAAAPGQAPYLAQLTFKGANKFLFQGITFQSLQNVPANKGRPYAETNPGTSDYFLIAMIGPNSNIIFNQNHLLSQADTSKWTTFDWLNKRVSGLTETGGSCFSITNNNIENIGFALGTQRASNVLISHNTINNFTDDGIDYGSNDLVIDGNRITNSIEDNDGFHRDGMQGSPYGDTPVSNVQITNNVVINQTTALAGVGLLQGIDAFDGVWQNVTIANNIVIVNSYHGITFAGASTISVVNNTVAGTNTGLGGTTTWIDIPLSKAGSASSNVIVRNNIAPYYAITGTAYIDHNVVVTQNVNYIKYFKPAAGLTAALLPASVFYAFNSTQFSYDMRLLQSNTTVNKGNSALAPMTDIRGLLRGKAIDLGALKFGGGPVVTLE